MNEQEKGEVEVRTRAHQGRILLRTGAGIMQRLACEQLFAGTKGLPLQCATRKPLGETTC